MKHHLTLLRFTSRLKIIFSLGALGFATAINAADANSFKPGQLWLDTAGKPINAHGGGMLYYQGTYYWYGEHKEGPTTTPACNKSWGGTRTEVVGVHCYSSTNLFHWKDEGLALRAVTNDPQHDLHSSGVLERPKVVFNAKTKKFVMWMHIDSVDYSAARAGVAVADQPTGPFTYLNSVRPEGQMSRDQTLFQDDDGTAYRVYASENNQTTYISRLSDDYLTHSGKFVKAFAGRSMEAQAICKRGGKYYLIASGCSGWAPNAARSAVADNIMGPWTEPGNPCEGKNAETTFGGQSTYLLPVAGKPGAIIFMADIWKGEDIASSRYLWLPVRFEDGKPRIRWEKSWNLSAFDH
ncbi:MAG: glycoside hydrolase family 43 protein [Verrucomicrobiota bacterium]